MGRFSSFNAPPAARDEPVASAIELKVPKPLKSAFERPWDSLVPAKSTGKLTLPSGVSKKFLPCASAASRLKLGYYQRMM
jgi:hypothetical protein